MEPDINSYMNSMWEMQKRVNVVEALINDKVSFSYLAPKIESTVLQIRKILELIALSSLAANKELFEINKKKFEDKWRVAKILKSIESINPGFYPTPIIEEKTKDEKVKAALIAREDGYLTKSELVSIHGRCGNILHASNPYGTQPDYNYFQEKIPIWMDKIMHLIILHKIQLLDNKFYLVRFTGGKEKKVSYNIFEKVD